MTLRSEPASTGAAADEPRRRGRTALAALALVALATAARWMLTSVLGDQLPFLLYYPAVALAAWYGGFAAGALAALLAGAVASIPLGGADLFAVSGSAYAVGLAVFILMGLLISVLSEQLHRARRAARAAANTVRLADERARRLFESSIMGTVFWEATGAIVDANDAFLAIAGLQRDDIRRTDWKELIAPECMPLHEAALAQIRERGECDSFDSILIRPDGTRVPIYCGGVSFTDTRDSGVTFVLDMSESRRARAALADSEDRYRTLFEGSPIGLIEQDWSAVNDRLSALRLDEDELRAYLIANPDALLRSIGAIRGLRVNPAALRVLGVPPGTEISPDLTIYVPPEAHEQAARVLAGMASRPRHVRYEQTIRTGSGESRQIMIELIALPGHETSLDRVLLSIVDISERKRTEEQREELLRFAEHARQQAETASRAKDDFLATVSHELRTPLSPILAWARMLRDGKLDAERTAHAYEVIERAARTQAQLIEDLLDVSRIMAGKLRLEVRPVSLAAVIERAVEVVRPSADAKGLRLHVVLDSEAGSVLGDDARLQQVVWNLLSNAVKFTPRGGRVQVSLERVNSHVEVAVADSGEGMDPSFLPHVFDRFRQADASTTRRQGGLGLGLAIVRHLVEAHGGSVHAESPGLGQGAVFTVKLPLMVARNAGEENRRHPSAPADHNDKLPRLDGLRILVVDDEPDSSEVVAELLTTYGAEVRQAASAEAAREVATRWSPTLLVSDVGMPGEDGYAFIAEWRMQSGEAARIPAVALTAYAGRTDKIRLLSVGFDAHVPKPLDPAELLTVIASLVRSTGVR